MKHCKQYLKLCIFIILTIAHPVHGQYFGKNKVNYELFPFKIYKTPHFQIYHYLDNEDVIEDMGQLAERWYQRHQVIFQDTFKEASPIIIYNNHADFQQTTVIPSIIGVGTGGVTEGYRNRVVMPVMKSKRETDHVLGHELVHVFQYKMFKNIDTLNLQSIGDIPLWMIEGLAEYMSIGRSDPQTAMWMRDAVLNDDIPTIRDMTRRPDKYFPYRYGHAFWSYITSIWGDVAIKPLLIASGMYGHERAIDSILLVNADTLSVMWREEIIKTHQPYLNQVNGKPGGEKIFDTPGAINIAPSVSPDGRYVIFLADRDVITIDFYVADIRKKKILRRLTRDIKDTHIDNYSFMESTGTWSPDSRQYALSLFSGGRKKLMIFNIDERSPGQILELEGLDYFDNPAWSPDGKSILLAGLNNGQSDLYLYTLETNELKQLTDDYYSDLHPAWSPDGNKVVFISDRGSYTSFERIIYGNYRLCQYHLQEDSIEIFPVFPGADIFNPQYAADGNNIYFVSTARGIQNIYEYNPGTNTLYRLSDFSTGVSSISELSPAFSMARDKNLMIYVLYEKKGYAIYKADPDEFSKQIVQPGMIDHSVANLVTESRMYNPSSVNENLKSYYLEDKSKFTTKPYQSEFKLETIGSAGIGVGFDQNNTAASGGISFLFSDILKRNQLFTALRVQGRLIDVGGQAVYINQKKRMNWGVSFSHIPYLSVGSFIRRDTIEELPVIDIVHMETRIFQDEVSLFGIYPLSKKLRFEAGISGSHYSFRIDSINYYYSGRIFLGEDKTQLDSPDPFQLYNAYIAYVGDNTHFGFTSPLRGYRYRIQLGRTQGRVKYWGILGDYRNYYFFKPVGLAYRVMHYGRYGEDAQGFQPLFLGYPYYVRGYEYRSIVETRCSDGECLDVNQIIGSKLMVAGAEVRLPFSGPRRLALIKSRYFFSDLVMFVDGGLAWHDFDRIDIKWKPSGDKHIPVFSTGISIRINLLGFLIIEPYYAIPFQLKDNRIGHLGINLLSGGW